MIQPLIIEARLGNRLPPVAARRAQLPQLLRRGHVTGKPARHPDNGDRGGGFSRGAAAVAVAVAVPVRMDVDAIAAVGGVLVGHRYGLFVYLIS